MMIFFRNGQKTTGERGVQRPPPPWIKGLNGLYADFTWLGGGGGSNEPFRNTDSF